MIGAKAEFAVYGIPRHSSQACGSLASWSRKASASRDLPMPASPVTSTAEPAPSHVFRFAHQARSNSRRSVRPPELGNSRRDHRIESLNIYAPSVARRADRLLQRGASAKIVAS